MKDFFNKTFAELNPSYYFRHLFFGIVISVLFFMLLANSIGNIVAPIFIGIINALLYPYSRFVYESIVNFIMGNNVFFFQGKLFLIYWFIKIWIMLLCWILSIVIAPIGLIYLYYYHSKNQN